MGIGLGQKIREFGKKSVGVMAKVLPPMVNREDIADAIGYVENAGAPSSVVPDFIGQFLFDTSGLDFYVAFGTASGEWAPLAIDTVTLAELLGIDGLLATALELNRAADVSTRLVAAGATEAITVAAHDGKTVLLDTAGGSVCTLPVAAATGARIRFAVTVRPSGGSHIIKVGNASDFMGGQIHMIDEDANAVTGYVGNPAADDTITINNTTTGGAIGDYIVLEDTLANVWTVVHGHLTVPAGSNVADPFSATV